MVFAISPLCFSSVLTMACIGVSLAVMISFLRLPTSFFLLLSGFTPRNNFSAFINRVWVSFTHHRTSYSANNSTLSQTCLFSLKVINKLSTIRQNNPPHKNQSLPPAPCPHHYCYSQPLNIVLYPDLAHKLNQSLLDQV